MGPGTITNHVPYTPLTTQQKYVNVMGTCRKKLTVLLIVSLYISKLHLNLTAK